MEIMDIEDRVLEVAERMGAGPQGLAALSKLLQEHTKSSSACVDEDGDCWNGSAWLGDAEVVAFIRWAAPDYERYAIGDMVNGPGMEETWATLQEAEAVLDRMLEVDGPGLARSIADQYQAQLDSGTWEDVSPAEPERERLKRIASGEDAYDVAMEAVRDFFYIASTLTGDEVDDAPLHPTRTPAPSM